MILSLDKIRTDGGTQARARLDPNTVEEYAATLASACGRDPFPHITVFYDGKNYWLADGFHRLGAYTKAGKDAIVVDVMQGSRREAVLFAVGANGKHGLRRTNEDKKRAIEILLRDEEWGTKSDVWVAEKCAVHAATVGRLRRDLNLCKAEVGRTGRDGKTRKLPSKPAIANRRARQAGRGSTAEARTSVASASDQVTDSVTSKTRGEPAAPRDEAPIAVPSTAPTSRSGRETEPPAGDPPWIEELIERLLNERLGVLVSLRERLVHVYEERGLSFEPGGR